MSRREGDHFIIEHEPPDTCELCGAYKELRPYGPHGERICFDCAMQNPEQTRAMYHKQIEGVTTGQIGDVFLVRIPGGADN